jgi:hypothetical protein
LKATLDIIEASESKDFYQDLYHNFRRYRADSAFKKDVLFPTTDEHWVARGKCFSYLNEIVALSCETGIIDEDFYARWLAPTVIRDWRAAEDLIAAARRPASEGGFDDRDAYVCLDRLCRKWQMRTRR